MKLSIQIEYQLEEKGAVITKVQGRAAEVRIPETIGGVPVVAIGERAFAVKEEAPVAEPEEELAAELAFVEKAGEPTAVGQALRRVFLPDSIETIGAYAFSGCSALERIHLPAKLTEISQRMFDGCGSLEQLTLPAGLRSIGDYAFYGCGKLKRLHLPEGVQQIGKYAFYNCRKMEEINIPLAAADLNMGLFLNCDSLTYLSFGRCRHISDLTSGLNHELHLTIDFPQENGETVTSRLIIPDFQYEYIEDTPARQFHQVNYGTGHIFRQCIGNYEIDFRRYDEIFYLTRREDAADTVLLLAMARLEYPYRLQEKHRQVYLEYIRDHFLWAAEYFMNRNQDEKIRLFADWGLLTAENLPALIEIAQSKGKTAVLSFLMDYQHKHFGATKKKKTFEL
ncbi:MAG: leucine-rich repeat domain-containing protein [Bacteroidales bacterium]|nr:leucine-rich repeat domain-containing protein [Anaerotignum sp.]MCI5678729.1 leucine-rich repeat domain-containing protein [Bacteroidales bacterium]MDY3927098.1 leucine-rich repeat domain-containing protein [Anaerotignum sp.]